MASMQVLMSTVDEHRQATGADDLFLALVVAGEIGLFFIV
jgi:hypothetical protein